MIASHPNGNFSFVPDGCVAPYMAPHIWTARNGKNRLKLSVIALEAQN
jgi:hypothetical protein